MNTVTNYTTVRDLKYVLVILFLMLVVNNLLFFEDLKTKKLLHNDNKTKVFIIA